MISFAQNFEDVILWRALKGVNSGFYIDLGAGDPESDSVSHWFYLNGWSGIEVEPNSQYFEELVVKRPRNIILKELVTCKSLDSDFFEIPNSGLSSSNDLILKDLIKSKAAGFLTTRKTITLETILNLANEKEIHWLKIDIEGSERDAIKSWKESKARPWILVIESTKPNTQILSHEDWEPEILSRDYEFVYFDGLNRFYLHKSQIHLKCLINLPPNYFDFFELSGRATNSFSNIIKKNLTSTQAELTSTQAELINVEKAYQSSRSWKFTRFARQSKYIILNFKVTKLSYFSWKLKSKFEFEKARIKSFSNFGEVSDKKREFDSHIEEVSKASHKMWADPQLIKLIQKRLDQK
jgi:FkbM family methyltransferase